MQATPLRYTLDAPDDVFAAVTDDPFSLRGHNVRRGDDQYFRVDRVIRLRPGMIRLRLLPA